MCNQTFGYSGLAKLTHKINDCSLLTFENYFLNSWFGALKNSDIRIFSFISQDVFLLSFIALTRILYICVWSLNHWTNQGSPSSLNLIGILSKIFTFISYLAQFIYECPGLDLFLGTGLLYIFLRISQLSSMSDYVFLQLQKVLRPFYSKNVLPHSLYFLFLEVFSKFFIYPLCLLASLSYFPFISISLQCLMAIFLKLHLLIS